jgi:hypothetical protein
MHISGYRDIAGGFGCAGVLGWSKSEFVVGSRRVGFADNTGSIG